MLRSLTATGLDVEVRVQRRGAVEVDQRTAVFVADIEYPCFDQTNPGGVQVVAQATVETRAVEQCFDVLRVAFAVPVHAAP